MNLRLVFMAIMAAFYLSACATAKRGSKQLFVVQTMPPGAKVETTLVEGKAPKLSERDYLAIKAGDKSEPTLIFKSCNATPCEFELPRKQEFDILVSKEAEVRQSRITKFMFPIQIN